MHRLNPVAPRRRQPGGRAFTLIELLIVIGIILILLGILLPAVSKIRKQVQNATTRQTLSRLEAGLAAYQTDFGAYPGLFANNEIAPATLPAALSVVPSGSITQVTGTENMVLGLLGGITTAPAYNPDQVVNARGPANLNPANIKRYSAYLTVQPKELTLNTPSRFYPTNTAGQGGQSDSIIPEILDSYNEPMPVLYMRANKGQNGLLAQYPVAQLAAYQFPQANSEQPYPANDSNKTFADYNPANGALSAGLEAYMGNPTLSTAGNVVPVQKDAYILISAGPDGRYGTTDDITNFR